MAGPAERRIAALREQSISSGQSTLNQGTNIIRNFGPQQLQAIFDEATVTNFMPQLRALQARAGRLGQRGPIMGALEGDLAAGFHRNLLSTVARTELDRGNMLADIGGTERAQGIELLGMEAEMEIARERAKQERKRRLWGTLGTLTGVAAGSFLGPLGAALGGKVASSLFGGNESSIAPPNLAAPVYEGLRG